MDDMLDKFAEAIVNDDEKSIADVIKEILKDEDVKKDEDYEEMKMNAEHLMEAVTSDDEKVTAMGNSIMALCMLEKFTPFELASMSATIVCEACRIRAKHKGIKSTKVFYESMVKSMNLAMDDIFEELEKDDKCEDDDCNCKCE